MDVGVIDDIQFGNPKSPRFVYWDKKLRATPSGPDVLTFDLLSIGGKLRAGMGLLGLRPKMPGQLKSRWDLHLPGHAMLHAHKGSQSANYTACIALPVMTMFGITV